jgi:arylsulfatase A-like enzyme
VAFETEGAEPRVLLEETVDPGQKQWQTKQIDLAEYNGRAGRLTVAAESTHEGPFRVFLSVGSPYKRRSAGDTNLILICLDTLRADHMSCYGYWRSTSPFTDSLAEKGVRFARCTSQAPWTGPSLFSVFTVQYAACGWDGYWAHGGMKWRHNRDAFTIANHLSARGFNTMAVTGGGVAGPGYGLGTGFNAFEVPPPGKIPEVYDRAVDWLEAHGRDKFFLFFHTYEIHEPYLRRIFSGGPRGMRVEAIQNYDSGILFADGYLEKLFGKLEEWGLLANTLVVIFSDHGGANRS